MNPRYLLLYLPVFLAYLVQSSSPSTSYWVAWGGSLWIYLVTFTGLVKELPTDRPVLNQVFRPFFFGASYFFRLYGCYVYIFLFRCDGIFIFR